MSVKRCSGSSFCFHPTLHIHARHGHEVTGRPAQFLQLLVKFLVADEVGGFGIPLHGLILQFVLLLTVLLHVQFLTLQHRRHTLHDGRHHCIERTKYHRGEHQYAKPDGKGTEQGEHVDGLRTGEGLPDTVGYVEQCPQSGYCPCHACHVRTERHHLVVETA